jgi:Sulfotransferase family
MTNPVVFIVGCPRSGTTLLRNIVSAHPRIVITPEAHWIPLWYENRKGLTPKGLVTPALIWDLLAHPNFSLFHLCKEEVMRLTSNCEPMSYASFLTAIFDLYGRMRGKDLVGNKTPDLVRKIDTLHSLWPKARFVHLIRDGRDVALSLMNWPRVSHKKPGTFKTWKDDPVSTAAFWWELNVQAGRDAGKSLGPDLYYEMRYESLVSDSKTECVRLCDFLDLPYDSSMLHYYREPVLKTNPELGERRDRQPITRGLRDWCTQMSHNDVERFEAAAGVLLEELGYERACPHVVPIAQQHAAAVQSILTKRFAGLY